MLTDSCWSYMSWYWRVAAVFIGLSLASTSLAERMALSIWLTNSDSNSCATFFRFASLSRSPFFMAVRRLRSVYAPESPEETPPLGILMHASSSHGSLNHDQVGLQRASLFQCFENRHQVAWSSADLVNRTDDLVQGGAGAELEHRMHFLLRIDLGARHHGGLAVGERPRLADDRIFGDGHRQAAVGHCRRRYLDVLADHDSAGTRVDDDFGRGLTRIDFQVFQHRQIIDRLVGVQRRSHAHRATVQRLSDAWAEHVVDLVDDALGGGEVIAIEIERQRVALVETAWHGTFHRRAARDTPRGRNVDGDLRAVATFGVKTAHHQVALGDGVDVTVDTLHRRHQQAATAQALGVTDGRHGDVDLLTGLGEWRQGGINRPRCTVF